MPSASHRNCESCHARRVDRRAAHNMCAPCRRVHRKRLQLERKALKARKIVRAQQTNGIDYSVKAKMQLIAHTANDEPEIQSLAREWLDSEIQPAEQEEPIIAEQKTTVPAYGTKERAEYMRSFRGKSAEERAQMSRAHAEPSGRGRGRRRPLSDEQEVEIIDAYTKTEEAVGDITQRYAIRETYIFNVLDRAGISWRRKNSESFEQWQLRQNPRLAAEAAKSTPEIVVPEPVEKIIEARVLPPQIEAMRNIQVGVYAEEKQGKTRAQPVEQAMDLFTSEPSDEPVWEVHYVGKMLVHARSVDEALSRARADGHIAEIVSVSRRPR